MKRKLLFGCILLAMVLSVAGCGKSKEVTTLIMADVQEGEHPTALACDKFAELVNEKTNGRIVIEVYHGSTLGTESEQVDQVAVGGIDFARVSSPVSKYYDDIKAFQALYLYSSEDAMWKVLDGEIGDEFLKSDVLKENGIEGLCWISGGSRNFYNNKKVITKPSDLAGLKLRVNTDSMFAFLDRCGSTGINVAYGDIYNSITAGVIDGAENNWPSYISTGHYEVAPYITVDEHTRIPEMIIVSTETMNSLSEKDQQIIRECAKEAANLQRKWMNEYDAKAIKQAEAAGCTITYLTAEQVAEFQKMAEPVNEKVSSKYIDIINKIKAAQ
ncbi:MAG: TRAP transporter substrate-binding protein [Lachnospiraceae bacterium]